jgi:hypothetical protein
MATEQELRDRITGIQSRMASIDTTLARLAVSPSVSPGFTRREMATLRRERRTLRDDLASAQGQFSDLRSRQILGPKTPTAASATAARTSSS